MPKLDTHDAHLKRRHTALSVAVLRKNFKAVQSKFRIEAFSICRSSTGFRHRTGQVELYNHEESLFSPHTALKSVQFLKLSHMDESSISTVNANGQNGPNKKALFVVVYVALFLDNMLMTTPVPFLPDYLDKLWHGDQCSRNVTMNSTSSVNHVTNSSSRPNAPTNCSRIGAFEGGVNAEFGEDSIHIGLLLGSKAFVQLLCNPIVGLLSNRVGYTAPMFFGFVILFISTLVFAFAESYYIMMLARAVQGMASACCSTCGLGMLAQVYTDSKERGAALSVALGGLALGVLFGFPFGGFLYDLSGKALPFLILAAIALFDAVLQLIFLPPEIRRQETKGTSLLKLIADPFIFIGALGIAVASFCISMMEPTLPLWMREVMGASSSTIALLFVPVTAAYVFGVHIFGPIGHKIGRWFLAFIGLLACGISLITISFPRTPYQLIAPNLIFGLSLGVFDAVIFPEMGNIVDLRHVGVYGGVYSIADAAVCCAFAFGPFISGSLVKATSFPSMLWIVGSFTVVCSPLMLLLRKPAKALAEKNKRQKKMEISTHEET